MTYLIEAARQYGLDDLAAQAMQSGSVHGILVGIHPHWMTQWIQHLEEERGKNPFDYATSSNPASGNYDLPVADTVLPMDLTWYPASWQGSYKGKVNLLIRILLRPGALPIQLSYTGSLFVVQEYQAVPRLLAHGNTLLRPLEGGVSVGSIQDPPGTLGGVLWHPKTKEQYVLTCGHVLTGGAADQPAWIDNNTTAQRIGGVCFRHNPLARAPGTLCNSASPLLNEMDIALVKLDRGVGAIAHIHQIGQVNGNLKESELHPNLAVQFHGRSSGHKTKRIILATSLINEVIQPDGSVCCFRNLLEIKKFSRTSLLFGQPVQAGDSGAWLIAQGKTGNEWAGMIIGGNPQSGYAIPAESIMTYLAVNNYPLECT